MGEAIGNVGAWPIYASEGDGRRADRAGAADE
jgi:hypothetical protein